MLMFIVDASDGVVIRISQCIHMLFNDKECFTHRVTTETFTAS